MCCTILTAQHYGKTKAIRNEAGSVCFEAKLRNVCRIIPQHRKFGSCMAWSTPSWKKINHKSNHPIAFDGQRIAQSTNYWWSSGFSAKNIPNVQLKIRTSGLGIAWWPLKLGSRLNSTIIDGTKCSNDSDLASETSLIIFRFSLQQHPKLSSENSKHWDRHNVTYLRNP